MRNTHDIWVCEVCKFKWLAFTKIAPDRCPSAKCRSRKWNASGEDRTKEPETADSAKKEAIRFLEASENAINNPTPVDKWLGIPPGAQIKPSEPTLEPEPLESEPDRHWIPDE